jgi:hypothetical protein
LDKDIKRMKTLDWEIVKRLRQMGLLLVYKTPAEPYYPSEVSYYPSPEGAELAKSLPEDLRELGLNTPYLYGLGKAIQQCRARNAELQRTIAAAKKKLEASRQELGTALSKAKKVIPSEIWPLWLKVYAPGMSMRTAAWLMER